jgi:hypothetical protein
VVVVFGVLICKPFYSIKENKTVHIINERYIYVYVALLSTDS